MLSWGYLGWPTINENYNTVRTIIVICCILKALEICSGMQVTFFRSGDDLLLFEIFQPTSCSI